MLSRVSRGRHLLTQSSSPNIQFQFRYLFQPCRNLSITRNRLATAADGETVESKEVKKILATFLVKPGFEIKLAEIIERLPQLPADRHLHLNSVLFLVTPSLAKAFETHHTFHASVINHIFGQRIFGARPQSVVAVVDAISKIDLLTPTNESIKGGEGIAVCISDRLSTIEEGDGSSDVPLIDFAEIINYTSTRTRSTSYLAPAANTLFLNGRDHTMIRQDWRPTSRGRWIRDLDPVHLRYININVNDSIGKHTSFNNTLHTTLEDLTEPARVKSSMGNIVRELETSSGATISASAELEEIVPNLLKRRNSSGEEGELRVYALVYPGSHGYTDGDDFKNLVKLPERQYDGRRRIHGRMLRSLLRNEGRLYRVTSGGAGWGKKAGLLSLEPRVDVRHQKVPEPVMPEFIFGEGGVTMPDSQQLIPPGSVIQFLATFSGHKNKEKSALEATAVGESARSNNTESWIQDSWFDGRRLQSMCIGTSPTTDLPETETCNSPGEHSGGADTLRSQANMIFLPNEFGFLSNSPMGIVCFLYDEHLSQGSTAIASNPAHLSSLPVSKDATLKLSVNSYTTLIEPPGTSFTMTYSAASGKELDTKNRVLSRQQMQLVVRRLPEKSGNDIVRRKEVRRSTQKILRVQLEKTHTRRTGDLEDVANAGGISESKDTNATQNITDTKNLEDTTSAEKTEDTIETQKDIPFDSTLESDRAIATRKTGAIRTRKSFRESSTLGMRIVYIEKMLSMVDSSLVTLRAILEKGVSEPQPSPTSPPRQLIPKTFMDRTSIDQYLNGRPRISRIYSRPPESRAGRGVTRFYDGVKIFKRHRRICWPRNRAWPRKVGISATPRRVRIGSSLEELYVRQKEYYLRNQAESQQLLVAPSNESEEGTMRAVKEISAEITEVEAPGSDVKRASTRSAFAVSIYGGVKDRVATKAAVNDLMEGLKEDGDGKD